MEPIAFWSLAIAAAGILLAGFFRPNGYLELPFFTAAVFLGWVVPQLWQVRQVYESSAGGYVTLLHVFCLACLLATVAGWHWGVRWGKVGAIRHAVTDDMLLRICIIITIVVVVTTIGIGAQAAEERARAGWSGPLTIMSFFVNLRVISLFLSIYLVLKQRNPLVLILLTANVLIYVPTVLLLFRRRAMLEALTCLLLALWFARRTIVPRVLILAAIPIGMLVVFAVGNLRTVGEVYTTEARWISLEEVQSLDFWAATPFVGEGRAPELTNALRIVRFSGDQEIHTYGAASWNRIVQLWVPGQLVGENNKRSLMLDVDVSQTMLDFYNEEHRVGSTPTAMGEAYLEFGFLGVVFFLAMGIVTGRWWLRARRGSRRAMVFYAIAFPAAVHMPTAYAIYFFNSIALHLTVLVLLVLAFVDGRAAKRRRLQLAMPHHAHSAQGGRSARDSL